jgi:methanogenic corrinoid protein MtbC1
MDVLTPEHVRQIRPWRRDDGRDVDVPGGYDGTAAASPHSLIWRTVERDVIPRLLHAHRSDPRPPLRVDRYRRPAATDIDGFVAALTANDLTDALTMVDAQRARGTRIEAIYLNLLLPAADTLARRWEADQCGYDDIALGMLHLQQMLHALAPAFAEESGACACGRSALLLSSPGEARMLGTYMVTEFHRCLGAAFFEHAGWEVWRGAPGGRAQLLSVLRTQWFDVIDIAATSAERLTGLAREVTEMRNASRNARVRVLASGPVFAAHPELAARIGADAAARNPRELMAQAAALAMELPT